MIETVYTRFLKPKKDIKAINKINRSNEYSYENLANLIMQPGVLGAVAVNDDDKILGFCIYSLEDNFFNILHLLVDKEFRRQGIGTAIINKMERKLNEKRQQLVCSVLETNLPMLLFLKSTGFKSRLFRTGHEDLIIFTKEKNA